jgi:hypothetical protein
VVAFTAAEFGLVGWTAASKAFVACTHQHLLLLYHKPVLVKNYDKAGRSDWLSLVFLLRMDRVVAKVKLHISEA